MPAPVSPQTPIGSQPDSLPGGFDAPLAVRALEAAGTGVCIADARRPMLPLVWANEAFSARTGLPREEIAGGSCRMLQWADTDSAELGALLAGVREGESPVLELKHRRRRIGGSSRISLSPVIDADGVLTHLIGVHEGAGTEAEPAAATHDALTGLPNRTVLQDRLDQALGRLRRRGGTVGVLFLDVDGLKQINDRYGHDAGDGFLRELPSRLRSALRADDTVARLSGDEFVILLEDCGGEAGAVRVAERVLRAFERPFTLGDETLALRVSVGIAVTEAHDERAADLLTNADVAMYRAKQSGGDGLALFDSSLRARANERVSLARDLRAAIGTDQLSLHYQPIVDLASQRVTSVEALVRWKHPARGQVPPDEFVRLAEDTGVIVELGRWVLERACTEFAAALDQAGDKRIELAVNLSPRQLADLGLPVLLREIMARTGLGRGRVALEITETALTDDADHPADRLWALKQEGVRIVLDDFGSGYSSLGHLRRFPIDAIKIDRSFVEGLGTQSRDAAIVGAILPMARALDLDVVAEGVENESKLAHLYALGCRQAQGYLFARPAPMADIAPLVHKAGSTSANRPAHPELDSHQASFKAALVAGDADEAGRVIAETIGSGLDGLAVQAQVIGPALAYIGDEWELGRLGVADEHLATAIAERALAMVFDSMRGVSVQRRGAVVLAAVEGEHHVLGLRMASDALGAAGFGTVYLGANVPEQSLLTAVSRHSPLAVCLTATVPAGTRALVAVARKLRSRYPGMDVIAGGPAVPAAAMRRSGVQVAESVEDAVKLVERAASASTAGAGGLAAAG